MIGVKHSWIVGCDAHMEPAEMSKHIWFRKLAAVIVAAEGATVIDEFPSALQEQVQLVLGAKEGEMKKRVQTSAKEVTRRKWRQRKGESRLQRREEEGRRKKVCVATMPTLENECEQTRPRGKNRQGKKSRTE